jgi:hypothetical protein
MVEERVDGEVAYQHVRHLVARVLGKVHWEGAEWGTASTLWAKLA